MNDHHDDRRQCQYSVKFQGLHSNYTWPPVYLSGISTHYTHFSPLVLFYLMLVFIFPVINFTIKETDKYFMFSAGAKVTAVRGLFHMELVQAVPS